MFQFLPSNLITFSVSLQKHKAQSGGVSDTILLKIAPNELLTLKCIGTQKSASGG
jgi:hypothetical protein